MLRLLNQARQGLDEGRGCADGGNAPEKRNALFLGEMTIFDLDLHQCFGMFRYKGDRRDNDRDLILPGAHYFGVCRGSDPFHRPNAALVTNGPIEVHPIGIGFSEGCNDSLCCLFALPLIGVSGHDDAFR